MKIPRISLMTAIAFVTVWHLRAQSVDVDPLTGRASASIPIWTITSGNLSAPIGLSYSTNGVKVHDGEGSAGMGWSLVAGGSVNREVRGLPDDYVGTTAGPAGDLRYGWLHGDIARQVNNFIPAGDQNFAVCSDEVADFNKLNGFSKTSDTEPDIFSFSAPGLGGQFVFDKNKVIQTIPYQDLKIVTTRGASDSLINQIEITTNLGVKYTFQSSDYVIRRSAKSTSTSVVNYFQTKYDYYRPNDCFFYSSWNLTSITAPTGASLGYTYGNYTDWTIVPHYFSQIVNNTTNAVDTVYSVADLVKSKDLLSISGAYSTATFAWAGSLLSMVTIKENIYNQEKKFRLNYKYIKSNYSSSVNAKVKRAFLSGFVEEVNCNAFPGYQFDYYGVNFSTESTSIPYKTSLHQDLFGYYNGTSGNVTPEVYLANGDVGTDGERYRIAPATGYSLIATGGTRTVNSAVIHYGALKTMTLPSGGTATITYEPADYFDAPSNTTYLGGGIRAKTVKTSANTPSSDVTSTYSYKRSKNSTHSSGRWIYRPMFAFNGQSAHIRVPFNLAPEEIILYSRVEISTTGKGRTVYEFQVPGIYAETANGDFGATFSRLARPQSASCPGIPTIILHLGLTKKSASSF